MSFACTYPQCGAEYKTRPSLRRHVRQKHNEPAKFQRPDLKKPPKSAEELREGNRQRQRQFRARQVAKQAELDAAAAAKKAKAPNEDVLDRVLQAQSFFEAVGGLGQPNRLYRRTALLIHPDRNPLLVQKATEATAHLNNLRRKHLG